MSQYRVEVQNERVRAVSSTNQEVNYPLSIVAVAPAVYFQPIPAFQISSILFNPTILMVLLPGLLMWCMPKMIGSLLAHASVVDCVAYGEQTLINCAKRNENWAQILISLRLRLCRLCLIGIRPNSKNTKSLSFVHSCLFVYFHNAKTLTARTSAATTNGVAPYCTRNTLSLARLFQLASAS